MREYAAGIIFPFDGRLNYLKILFIPSETHADLFYFNIQSLQNPLHKNVYLSTFNISVELTNDILRILILAERRFVASDSSSAHSRFVIQV